MPDVIRVTRALVLTRGATDRGARARGEIAAAVPRRNLNAEVIAESVSHLRMRFVDAKAAQPPVECDELPDPRPRTR